MQPQTSPKNRIGVILSFAFVIVTLFDPSPLRSQIFISDYVFGKVGSYSLSGTPINASLITGATYASSLVVEPNGHILVANWLNNRVAEYTGSGSLVNASLILGSDPVVALDGADHIFVANFNSGTIG